MCCIDVGSDDEVGVSRSPDGESRPVAAAPRDSGAATSQTLSDPSVDEWRRAHLRTVTTTVSTRVFSAAVERLILRTQQSSISLRAIRA